MYRGLADLWQYATLILFVFTLHYKDPTFVFLFFIIATTPLSTVIYTSAANDHLYADDTQLILSFPALDFSHDITHLS